MSRVTELNLPPEQLYKKIFGTRKNVEHIILWMLKNNDVVGWAEFLEEPISIPQSTLSNYLKSLYFDGYIEKVKRGEYRITSKGTDRFNELSRAKEGHRKLSYPPKVISKKRNYDHIILWMAYNNNYLRWSDFLNDKAPVFINQSALSKNINILLKKELVSKDDNKVYKITQTGKSEYARVLKLYDLDRQSILNEESKRIEEITRRTIRFFERYNIVDDDIKFRFLNNVLTLPFEKLKGSLDTETDFNKILFYLSMNHPNQYPEYISPEKFSRKYKIDKLDLEFNIRKIIEKDVYPTKFFKLDTDGEKTYYFQENEKIEKVLRAVTEDQITKFTYLNKLYEKIPNGTPQLTLESTVEAILSEICDHLFDNGLKDSLRVFLSDYINYLAYKMEKEKKLVDIADKLEGTIWQEFQSYRSANIPLNPLDNYQGNYYLYPQIFDILEEYYLIPSISPILLKSKELLKNKKYNEILDLVNSKIESGIKDKELLLFKAIILSHMNKYIETISIVNDEIEYEKYEDNDKIYMVSSFILSFAYMALSNIKEALIIIDKVHERYPDHPISLAIKAIVYGYSFIYNFDLGKDNDNPDDHVLGIIDNVITIDPNVLNKARYHQYKSQILEQMDKFEEALEEINFAIDIAPEIVDLYYTKIKIYASLKKYEDALDTIEAHISDFPDSEKYFLMQKAYVLSLIGDYQTGLKIITDLTIKYPDEENFFNSKSYWHVTIYKKKRDEGIEDLGNKNAAIETIKYLNNKFPNEGNYFDTHAEILFIIGDYDESIKMYEKAIEVEPNGWFLPASFMGLGKCYEKRGKFNKAEVYLDKAKQIVRFCFLHIKNRKEWIEDIEYHLKKVRELKADT